MYGAGGDGTVVFMGAYIACGIDTPLWSRFVIL